MPLDFFEAGGIKMKAIEKLVYTIWVNLDGNCPREGIEPSTSNKELALRMLYLIKKLLDDKRAGPLFEEEHSSLLESRALAEFSKIRSISIEECGKSVNPFSALGETEREIFVPYMELDELKSLLKIDDKDVMINLLKGSILELKEPIDIKVGKKGEVEMPKNVMVRFNPYMNRPTALAKEQTISAPYMVLTYGILAGMKEKVDRVFEGGFGSGYHLAYKGNLYPTAKFFGSDVHEDFCEMARKNIKTLDDMNQTQLSQRITLGAGNCLRPSENAVFMDNRPYDLIYFTFMMPNNFDFKPYFDSLCDGGILISPVNSPVYQEAESGNFTLFVKNKGKTDSLEITACSFVPAVR